MDSSRHEFVTVDMRGIKAALVAKARANGVSVSKVVRTAVTTWMGLEVAPRAEVAGAPHRLIKLSLRFTHAQVQRLDAGARAASLSRAAYLAGLVDGVPMLTGDAQLVHYKEALTASNAELAGLVRSVRQLSSLFQHGSSQVALEYRSMRDGLETDVRRHLQVAGAVLAALRPRAPVPESATEHGDDTRR